jgi:nucleotide-binding universal stress UspA family protein
MKILVAVDGSKNSLSAAKYAAKLAASLKDKSHLTLISVHDDTALKHLKKYVPKDTVSDYLRGLSEKDIASAQKLLDKLGVAHDMVIHFGHPAEQIKAVSETGKFDLIVMGSKGRSSIKDLVVGSVAHKLLAIAKVPVLMVK